MRYGKTVVWNKAMGLAEAACIGSVELPAQGRYGIRLQITRAAVSVASNMAEGWTREPKRERRQFLAIAHGSSSELHAQLELCERIGWLSSDTVAEPIRLIDEISRMLTALRRKERSY